MWIPFYSYIFLSVWATRGPFLDWNLNRSITQMKSDIRHQMTSVTRRIWSHGKIWFRYFRAIEFLWLCQPVIHSNEYQLPCACWTFQSNQSEVSTVLPSLDIKNVSKQSYFDNTMYSNSEEIQYVCPSHELFVCRIIKIKSKSNCFSVSIVSEKKSYKMRS